MGSFSFSFSYLFIFLFFLARNFLKTPNFNVVNVHFSDRKHIIRHGCDLNSESESKITGLEGCDVVAVLIPTIFTWGMGWDAQDQLEVQG